MTPKQFDDFLFYFCSLYKCIKDALVALDRMHSLIMAVPLDKSNQEEQKTLA